MPLMQLKMLVLPAPLGPMIAKKSPGSTERLTPDSAATPPKCRCNSSRLRRAILGAGGPLDTPGPVNRPGGECTDAPEGRLDRRGRRMAVREPVPEHALSRDRTFRTRKVDGGYAELTALSIGA